MKVKKKIKKIAKPAYYGMLTTLLDPKSEGLDPYEEAKLKKQISEMLPGSDYAAVKLIIRGEVTRVGYKKWLARRARLLGLDNFLRYKGVNKVQAIVIGDGEDIEDLIRDAWKGSKRSKVVSVEEHWYNKPKKEGADLESDDISWSQETADAYIHTLDSLKDIMKTPRVYEDQGKKVGTDELIRVARKRNVFYSRLGLKELYFEGAEYPIALQRSQSTRVSSLVHYLTDHKQAAKDFLEKSRLPIPRGYVFDQLDKAKEFYRTCENPMVVKPAVGLNGTGVSVDIRSEKALVTAWQYAKHYHDKVVIEEMILGVDIRVVVIGGKAKAALLRVPANVKGDGEKNIEELITEKNALRLTNPRLRKNLIIRDAYTDAYLKRQGHSMKSVPKKGEVLFLHLKANICKGADSISITEYIHPDLMRLAEEASRAFGVEDYWGIDLLVGRIDQPRDQDQCAIIELNSTANIENVIYPLYGSSFDSANELVSHLLPKVYKDEEYPLEDLLVKITGNLPDNFTGELEELAEEFQVTIKNIPVESYDLLVMEIAGRRQRVLEFLDNAQRWKDATGYVDGLRILDSLEDIKNEKHRRKTPIPDDREINRYEPRDMKISPNIDLFVQGFKNKGYNTEYLYEGLLKITSDAAHGITGAYHSSLFSDKICEKKYPAKQLLNLYGIPTLRGRRIKYTQKHRGRDYVEFLGGEALMTRIHPTKPKTGVAMNLRKFKRFWKKSVRKGSSALLIEENIQGYTVVVPVVRGEAHGAFIKEPVKLQGDASATIEELLNRKNELRKNNPYYHGKEIQMDQKLLSQLRRQGYTPDSVLFIGEEFEIESETKFKYGGELTSIGEDLHEGFKKYAVDAVRVMPGLEFAYVTLIVPNPKEDPKKQKWAVYEIDTKPEVSLAHYPWKGTPVNITEKVIENLCLSERTRWIQEDQQKNQQVT